MNLLHPTEFAKQPVIVVLSPQFSFTDHLLQLTATVSMHFGFFYDLKLGEVATIKPSDIISQINSRYLNYNKVRHSLNICANTGEAVDDSLLQLLEKILPERKVEFAKMDFLKRRDEFSTLIKKSETIKKMTEFDTKDKRNDITRTFSQFIKLRNYYTHGKLILKYETEQYYIQIIDKSTGIRSTLGIDRKILTSYLNTGTELVALMTLIKNNILQ